MSLIAPIVVITWAIVIRITFIEIMNVINRCFDGAFMDPTVRFRQIDRLTPAMCPVEFIGGNWSVR